MGVGCRCWVICSDCSCLPSPNDVPAYPPFLQVRISVFKIYSYLAFFKLLSSLNTLMCLGSINKDVLQNLYRLEPVQCY